MTVLVLVSESDIVDEGVLLNVSDEVLESEEEKEGEREGPEPIPTRNEHDPATKPMTPTKMGLPSAGRFASKAPTVIN